jgi:hypothetical protein
VTFGGPGRRTQRAGSGRFGRLGVRATALTIAGIGFVAIYAMPFLAYPPNPPAVGRPETIGYRSAVYFLMMAISLIAAITAIMVGRRMARRWEPGTPDWPRWAGLSRRDPGRGGADAGHQRSAGRLPGHAVVRLPGR